LALVATFLLLGCGSDGTPVDLDGREIQLTLLHTADWHSRLFPYQMRVSATDASLGLDQSRAPFGGAARMNWLIQRERQHSDRVLHLDTGDCFQGAPIFNFFNGEAEVRALNQTGVDAVIVGNHEFDQGALNFYRQYSRWSTFPLLAANYLFEDPTIEGSAELGRIVRPYVMLNARGLRVAVIGMGNLSSITSIFDQRNRLGITPLNTRETAQFYLDQVRQEGADLVVGVTHLGLEDDQTLIEHTSGFDVVLGGHLHIVTNPTLELHDCQPEDDQGHFIPLEPRTQLIDPATGAPHVCDTRTECCDPTGVCPPEPARGDRYRYWRLGPGYTRRACTPRTVLLQHSGAFMKYLGRLDLVISNDPERIGTAHDPMYDRQDRFEVVGHRYTLFPVDSTVPEEPTMARLLEPYARALDTLANLDTIIGYAPNEVSRTAVGGGDSPMGNLVSTAMWLRLGVQTDFALTNTLGIRDAIPPGAVTIDQVYNVFPFDNSITTMFLSGREVVEMFDFVARRSAGRGCNSQAQIAGARVVLTCGSCDRDGVPGNDTSPGDNTPLTACAETVNIGLRGNSDGAATCERDSDCYRPADAPQDRSLCDTTAHRCMAPLALNASYALAANNYIAAGGSGFFVLQRNTTQVDTLVQQRDAVIDRIRAGNPCGYHDGTAMTYRATHPDNAQQPDDGLEICNVDGDCDRLLGTQPGEYTCSCDGRVDFDPQSRACSAARSCGGETGRCVLTACATAVAQLAAADCPGYDPTRNVCTAAGDQTGTPDACERCSCAAQSRGAQSCRILACIDERVGAVADGRLRMVSR
jgi:5'-nucleotidase